MADETDSSDDFLVTGGAFRGRLGAALEGELDRAAAGEPAEESALESGGLVGRYRIIGHLGSGGMGRVLRAEDTHLGREVALKLLPDHLSWSPSARARLEREARAISSLNHPNLCVLYEAGSRDGQPYLVFELVEGRVLSRLLREEELSVDRSLEIAEVLADALETAHRRGVLHRDVKPGNVMVTPEGRVKLLDFGIAKVTADSAGANADLTQEGTVPGTVAYMSPEQVRREELDARSDVFSLGAVLYEMLAGVKAFPGAGEGATVSAVLHDEPKPLEELGHRPQVGALVRRALAKDRTGRFESAAALRDEIRAVRAELALPAGVERGLLGSAAARVALAVTLAVAVLGAAALLVRTLRSEGGALEAQAPRRVAVLRFEDLAGFPDAALAVSVPDDIASVLSGARGIALRPFSESLQLDVADLPVAEAARRLGADLVVGGQILAEGSGLRLSVEATEADSGRVVWRETLRLEEREPLQVRRRVSSAIEGGLLPALGATAAPTVGAPSREPRSAQAYRLYVGALDALTDPLPGREAIAQLRRAVVLDPEFAPAWAELARRLRIASYYFEEDSAAGAEEARRAAERAIELDPSLLAARWLLIDIQLGIGESRAAARSARALAAARPDLAAARLPEAIVLRYQGRVAESAALCDAVYELDPGEPQIRQCVLTYLWNGEPEKAHREAERTTSLVWQNEILARSALMRGDRQRALALWRRQVDPSAGLLRRDAQVACLSGDGETARAGLERDRALLLELRDSEWKFYSAGLFAACGRRAESLGLLAAALRDGYCVEPSPAIDPLLGPLAGSPELEVLVQRAMDCREELT